MLVSLAPRLLLLVLVSLQTHSTLFLVPALGLVNAFIPEDALVLVALSDAPPGVSQLLKSLGMHLLSSLLPLRRRKVKRRRSVLVPEHLLLLGSLQASSLSQNCPSLATCCSLSLCSWRENTFYKFEWPSFCWGEQGPCLWGNLCPPGPFVNQFNASWPKP